MKKLRDCVMFCEKQRMMFRRLNPEEGRKGANQEMGFWNPAIDS